MTACQRFLSSICNEKEHWSSEMMTLGGHFDDAYEEAKGWPASHCSLTVRGSTSLTGFLWFGRGDRADRTEAAAYRRHMRGVFRRCSRSAGQPWTARGLRSFQGHLLVCAPSSRVPTPRCASGEKWDPHTDFEWRPLFCSTDPCPYQGSRGELSRFSVCGDGDIKSAGARAQLRRLPMR